MVGVTLEQGISQLDGGIKAFVSAYCGSSNVDPDVWPQNGSSPVFTGAAATTNAKAAEKIGAYSSFTLVLN
jgi:hypothetical protein